MVRFFAGPWSLGLLGSAGAVQLSVILCGRNDGHAGDFLDRLRLSLLTLSLGLCQHRRESLSEVVLVEWRPPAARRRLGGLVSQWLSESSRRGDFDCEPASLPPIRVVAVADDVAEAMPGGAAPGARVFNEWQCKGIGLRRAAGEFLVVTNADTLWSPALFNFVSTAHLVRKDSFYVTHPVEFEGPMTFLLAQGAPFFQMYGQIFLGSHSWNANVHRYVDRLRARFPVISHSISEFLCKSLSDVALDARREAHRAFWDIYDRQYGVKFGVSDDPAKPACRGRFQNLFDNQVGDFILASRGAWHAISGPPMLPGKLYIDTLVTCRLASRFRQVLLSHPCFFFHQAHVNNTPKREVGRHDSELNGHNIWERCCQPFRQFESEVGFNLSDWGLASISLPEEVVQVRRALP